MGSAYVQNRFETVSVFEIWKGCANMRKILTAAQMKSADERTIAGGVPSLVLMERAAMAVVQTITEEMPEADSAIVLCGTGNNGGDGFAVARILSDLGYRIQIVAPGSPDHFSPDRKQQEAMLKPYGIPVYQSFSEADRNGVSLLVDALFGIGLSREISGDWKTCIDQANASGLPIAAVDMPSGIHTDTGAVLGTAVKAAFTVTFSAPKAGLLLYPGKAFAGKTFVRQIGIRTDREDSSFLQVEEEDLSLLRKRKEDGNKGTFGKVLVIAGSHTICGAAYLSAEAALRSGAGMVKIYTEEANRTALAASFPEALLSVYSEWEWSPETLKEDLNWADAVLIGPGISCGSTAGRILKYVLEHSSLPLILDADALNLLAGKTEQLRTYPGKCVLTPHCMEMSRLTGLPIPEIKQNAPKAAEELAKKTGAAVVLKDASTVIADPDGTVWLYSGGSSALATAGSGDVLAGLMAGLTARFRHTDLPAAALAVCLHGCCGLKAAEAASAATVLAGDLTAYLPLFL